MSKTYQYASAKYVPARETTEEKTENEKRRFLSVVKLLLQDATEGTFRSA